MSPRAWPVQPGVPAAGHVTSRGFWHNGHIDTCAKCEVPKPCARCGRQLLGHQCRFMWSPARGSFRLCKDTRACERREKGAT